MERVVCFTSFTFSYLGKARFLAWSMKRFHPEWEFVAVITDSEPEGFNFEIESEAFDTIMWGQKLPVDNIKSWMFMHNIVEICTAVKGTALDILINSGADKVIYLDPDIAVFESLQPVVDLLDKNDVVLTPHQLNPDVGEMGVRDNEIGSLKYGIYNLGFIAVSNRVEGKRFSRWWADRLIDYCFDDVPNGLFTDQRWCDHVPVFFDNVKILKDPGYNVASWNLSNREITIDLDGRILVNDDYLLRFYHFTKLGPLGEAMTARYAGENIEVYEIWQWYQRTLLDRFEENAIPPGWWYFEMFDNGEKITHEMRRLYKQREDLQEFFSDPYDTKNNCFLSWYVEQGYEND